ncbi:hypothetical protein BGX28_000554 [Mortierella sp. GBA30]|nr:hypothetical protein BGX28_000554 [Mortierella sp. GBA30]
MIAPNLASTQSAVTVRVSTPEDTVHVHEIHALVNKAYRSDGSWKNEVRFIKADRCTVEDLEAAILDTENPFLIAFDSQTNQPLGTMRLSPHSCFSNLDICKPVMTDEHLENSVPENQQVFASLFSVDPSQQSRGVGGILTGFAFRYAIDIMRRKQAVIYVIEQRPALLDWYLKLGFKDCGERIPFPFQDRVLQENVRLVVLRLSLVGYDGALSRRRRMQQNRDQPLDVSARL